MKRYCAKALFYMKRLPFLLCKIGVHKYETLNVVTDEVKDRIHFQKCVRCSRKREKVEYHYPPEVFYNFMNRI